MSDSVDRVFVHALNTVKRIPRSGSARPPLPERLRLYGLYKQSMEGDVEGVMDRPVDDGTSLQAEREKWDAWYAQRHLSRTEAKRQYITALLDTMNKYASSTPEARELISELEFVWDQIKSNRSSSSSSGGSPIHAHISSMPQSQPQSHIITPPSRSNYGSQYGSIGGRISRAEAAEEGMDRPLYAGRNSRLRVLSPVSQPDVDMPGGGGRRSYDGRAGEGSQEGEAKEQGEEDEDDDEEDEEDFQEALDSPYEDDDDEDDEARSDDNNNSNQEHDDDNGTRRRRALGGSDGGRDQDRDKDRDKDNKDKPKPKGKPSYNRRWRRRVEQAMTKMTAEVAAMREQMETRALNNRRRSGLWAWIKWVVWVVVRQVCWHIVLLGCVLVWLRVVKGDRRLEETLRGLKVWTQVRKRVAAAGKGRGMGFRFGGFP